MSKPRLRVAPPAGALAACAMGLGAAGCGGSEGGVPEAPTYTEHVAPIAFARCAPCHRPDGVAPFSVLDHESIRPFGPRIVELTRDGIMPPWLPEPGFAHFDGERILTEVERATLARWVEQGAPLGDPAELPPVPEWPSGWELGTPDLVVELEEPFPLPRGVSELFRNFVLPVPISAGRWVRGVEIRPSEPRVVHHASLMVDESRSSRRQDASDPGLGWDGMLSEGEARNPGGFLLGWTPGKVPSFALEGLAWRLEPGTDLVLQLHLRPIPEVDHVGVRLGLYFADVPPTRIPFVLRLGSRTIDIPAGEASYGFEDSYRLPIDVEAIGIYPHAHYLGTTMHVWATLPDSSRSWLLRIDGWDFNWQDVYRYAAPVPLPAGSLIQVRYRYDNSADNPLNPSDPPRRVLYGPESADEMAELWLQVVPRDTAELGTLVRDFGQKDIRDRVEGWEWALDRNPEDALAHSGLGAVLQARGELAEAEAHYRTALAVEPRLAAARYNLALILETTERFEEAAEAYRETIRIAPDHADAHNNLGNLLAGAGRLEEAIPHYEEALTQRPGYALAHNNLGNVYRSLGRLDEAIDHYRAAVERDTGYAQAFFNLGLTLGIRGDDRQSLPAYRAAARLRPDWPAPLASAAWIMATHPDDAVRRPGEAVRLAERAAELTEYGEPAYLDALAAAYASARDFERAVAAAERAVQLAERAGRPELATAYLARLSGYRRGIAFRQPPRAGGTP